MMRLISPTLLDSFAYYQGIDDEEQHEQSRQELLNRLRGVKTPPTEAMERGIQFEKDVCDVADRVFDEKGRGLSETHLEIVRSIGNKVRGAERQVHVGYWLNNETLVHGYVDFLMPGLIIDTKTTGRAYEWGKYLDNCQHLVYLLALNHLGYRHFAYFIAVFGRDEAKELVHEDYYYSPRMADTLKSRCADFFDYLTVDAEMSEAYYSRNYSVPQDLVIKGAA